jgi:hypothetical protein
MHAIGGTTCVASALRIRCIPPRSASRKASVQSGYTRQGMHHRSLKCTFVLALPIQCSTCASELLRRLPEQAPDPPPQALTLALEARDRAIEFGAALPFSRLAGLEDSRPSAEQRVCLFDLQGERLRLAEHVAPERGSGRKFAPAFSNNEGSHQSSLGLFLTEGVFVGGDTVFSP